MPRSTYRTLLTPRFVLVVDEDRGGPSVTNDAENVIADLGRAGALDGRRVLYRDSVGRWDEILVSAGRFAGFAPIGAASMADAVRRAVLG